MIKSASLALAGLALLLATPSCSKKKEEASSKKAAEPAAAAGAAAPSAPDAPAAGGSQCDAVPASMVSEVLGLPGFAVKKAENHDPVTVCEYERSGKPRSVTLRIETGSAGWDMYKEQVKDYEVKDIPGLGDKAYRYTMGGSGDDVGNNVVVLKGQTIIQVSLLGGDPAKLAELGRRIAAAL